MAELPELLLPGDGLAGYRLHSVLGRDTSNTGFTGPSFVDMST